MSPESLQNQLLSKIEKQLITFLHSQNFEQSDELKEMIAYHMGWGDDGGSHGKRIRPLLTILTAGAFGGDIEKVMPAAIAVEFLHNFTLIHDDIEDNASIRHGRMTLWKKWGLAQGVNAGDALFSIAQLAMLSLNQTCGQSISIEAVQQFNLTCLHLTRGQYLDISFESSNKTSIDSYFAMILGKTAALISLAIRLGGLTSHQNEDQFKNLAKYGEALGMAFQIQDDYLGVWGDPIITGKSAASDLITKKKSLPIIYGLQHSDEFKRIWENEEVTSDNVGQLAKLLISCGAQEFTKSNAGKFTRDAFSTLEKIFPRKNIYSEALFELTELLLDRDY